MKVILKGIRPYDPELDGEMDDDLMFYRSLLEQVSYPLEIEAEDKYPNVVNLAKYIIDDEHPHDLQRWGLVWFDYEKVKEVQG